MTEDVLKWRDPRYQRNLNRAEVAAIKIAIEESLRGVSIGDVISYNELSEQAGWPVMSPYKGNSYLGAVRRTLEHDGYWFRAIDSPYGLERVSAEHVARESPEKVRNLARMASNHSDRLALVEDEGLTREAINARDTSRVLYSMIASVAREDISMKVQKKISANTSAEIDMRKTLQELGW